MNDDAARAFDQGDNEDDSNAVAAGGLPITSPNRSGAEGVVGPE